MARRTTKRGSPGRDRELKQQPTNNPSASLADPIFLPEVTHFDASSSTSTTTTDMASPATANLRRLFICSIGNPAPYEGTRHSAGHIFLHKLPQHLHTDPTSSFGPSTLQKSSSYKGLLLPHTTYTLFQSPTFMNVSGPAISHAWKLFLRERCPTTYDRDRAQLVILHDELDKDGGKIKLKRGGSAGGHNGIESIIGSLGTKDFLRLGIGIGRPKGIGKDSRSVADYVLGKFNDYELSVLEERSLPLVVDALVRLAKEP